MRFGSVCSGIEAASCAWEPLGWRPAWFSEIAPFPSRVLAHRFPEVPNHGSLVGLSNRLTGSDRSIDVLAGGTPCQSFSVAGLRGGLADARGNLALEFARLAASLRPRWVVWENVPGVLSSDGGRAFASLIRGLSELGYGLAWRVLDAQFFGVAQRRERVFLVGHLGAAAAAGAVLFEPEGVRRNPPSRGEAGQDVAGTLTSGAGGGRYDIAFNGRQDPVWGDVTGALDTDPSTQAVCVTSDVTHALRAVGCDASEDGNGRGTPIATSRTRVRRLTPREAERLQGFPDDWTRIDDTTKDTPRYAALGNSMAVPVMRWLGERIARVDAILRGAA